MADSLSTVFQKTARGLPAAAQEAILKDKARHDSFAENQSLLDESFLALWGDTKPALARAKVLAERVLPRHLRDHIFAVEKRPAVLAKLAAANSLERDEVLALAGAKLPASTAERILEEYDGDDEVLSLLGPNFAPIPRLSYMASVSDTALSDADLAASLIDLDSWWGKAKGYQTRRAALTKIFETRPQLVARVAIQKRSSIIAGALAGSRHITTRDQQAFIAGLNPKTLKWFHRPNGADQDQYFMLSAMVYNPVVHDDILEAIKSATEFYDLAYKVNRRLGQKRGTVTEPFETLDDRAQLDWVCNRTLPFRSYRGDQSPGRPWDMLALAKNPNISLVSAQKLADALHRPDVIGVVSLKRANEALASLAVLHEGINAYENQESPAYVYHGAQEPYEALVPGDIPAFLTKPCWLVVLYDAPFSAPALETVLGDSVPAWSNFISMLDEVSPDTPIGEVADTAFLLASLA